MVIRQVKMEHWEQVLKQITTYGKNIPQTYQYDIEMNCNGIDYILKVQPEKKRKLVALQALSLALDSVEPYKHECRQINNSQVLSALLELIVFQGAEKRK